MYIDVSEKRVPTVLIVVQKRSTLKTGTEDCQKYRYVTYQHDVLFRNIFFLNSPEDGAATTSETSAANYQPKGRNGLQQKIWIIKQTWENFKLRNLDLVYYKLEVLLLRIQP